METMSLYMKNLRIPRMSPVPVMKRKVSISCKIAVQTKKTNFYKVLSLDESENVGFDEIKKAYRRMALRYHPDVCPPAAKEESTRRFVELQEAYETLSNPVSRRLYDYELGLVNSMGFGFGFEEAIRSMEEIKGSGIVPMEVWEMQLYGLQQRSRIRMQRKKNKQT